MCQQFNPIPKELEREKQSLKLQETIKIRVEINERDKKSYKRSVKVRACFLQDKIGKHLNQIQEKKGLKVRNERADITTDSTEI